jgi:hypothetical protein
VLRRATNDDYHAFVGRLAPEQWTGLVSADEHLIHGIGGVYLASDGRWWMFFDRVPGVAMSVTTHRAARIVVDAARESGIVVHAISDLRMPTSERWLTRLGFVQTSEEIEGHPVWVLT